MLGRESGNVMSHRPIEWYEETEWLHRALAADGAFLVVNKPSGAPNPMTIGWGLVGIGWGVPLFVALVRRDRYTYECVQDASSFVVSVPEPGELKHALHVCGAMSGRDSDKPAAAELTMLPAQSVDTPVVAECGLHYECEIVVRTQQQRSDFASRRILETVYAHGDNHHQAVFGRIIAAYVTPSPDGTGG